MRLSSLNIKGGGDIDKVSEVIKFLQNNNIDIALLCESHMTEEKVTLYKQRWQTFTWYTNCVSENSCGVTFVILKPDQIKLRDRKVIKQDTQGRVLGIQLEVEGPKQKYKTIRILGLYAPNQESDSVNFFNNIHAGGDTRFHIMLGNFDRCQDAHNRNPARSEDMHVLNNLDKSTQNDGLIDGWRMLRWRRGLSGDEYHPGAQFVINY
jgi:exonuclease III